jgi:ATP-dependent Clp protease ATP-binding subunit ClpA
LREDFDLEPALKTREGLEISRIGPQACQELLGKELEPTQNMVMVAAQANETPFVGREDLIRELEEFVGFARKNIARLVIIEGEPGAGKSRLARELAQRLLAQTSSRNGPVIASGTAGLAGLPSRC